MTTIEQNPRGIPKAPFVQDVQVFMKGSTHEQTLLKFQEMIQKYRFMETHLVTRQAGLESKIPEIKKSVDVVKLIATNKEIKSDFELNDTLWVRATIPPTKKVNLWLGVHFY
jgi:hypothetical protein